MFKFLKKIFGIQDREEIILAQQEDALDAITDLTARKNLSDHRDDTPEDVYAANINRHVVIAMDLGATHLETMAARRAGYVQAQEIKKEIKP